MKKNIQFYSEGNLIKGILYIPENVNINNKCSAIILCHGFAGIKEFLLPNFAEKFCQNGYAVLTFDYRGFGESEGTRGKLSPKEQIIDIRNAITFLQTIEEINSESIGLWGTSYGGANAIIASSIDKRIKCLSVQLTFGNGERVITDNLTIEEKDRLYETIQKVWSKSVLKNKEMMVTIDKILTDEQSIDFYNKNVNKFPSLKTKIPFLTIKETIEHKPENYLKYVTIPILIICAENDQVNPKLESEILYEKANEPKEFMIVKNSTHYEVYEGDLFEEISEKQIKWFKKYLS